jgi:hypothetical protein
VFPVTTGQAAAARAVGRHWGSPPHDRMCGALPVEEFVVLSKTTGDCLGHAAGLSFRCIVACNATVCVALHCNATVCIAMQCNRFAWCATLQRNRPLRRGSLPAISGRSAGAEQAAQSYLKRFPDKFAQAAARGYEQLYSGQAVRDARLGDASKMGGTRSRPQGAGHGETWAELSYHAHNRLGHPNFRRAPTQPIRHFLRTAVSRRRRRTVWSATLGQAPASGGVADSLLDQSQLAFRH